MAPVKGQKKSSVGKWIDGKVHNFKKASKVKSPEPKVKNRRCSLLLKRLDISIHELPSSPNSPHRASMRRTRRMSMAPAAAKATAVTAVTKKPPVSSKIPKSLPKNMSSSTTSSVAKMVASTSPSKPRLTLGNRGMSGQTLTSSSVSRQSRSFSRSVTTQKSGKIESTTSLMSNESWIEQISSPTVFYRVSSPGKVMGAQRRKSYTTATDIVQVEPDEMVQKRVRERSESPVNPKTRKQASSVKKLRLSSSSFPRSEKRTTRAVKSASHIAERSTGSRTSGKNVESPRKTTRARTRASSRSLVNKSPTSPLKEEKENVKLSPEISVKIRRIENSVLSAEDQASFSASGMKFSKASGSSPLKKRTTTKATSPKQVQTNSGSTSKSLSPGAGKTRSPATKNSSLRPRRSSLVTNKKSPLRTGFLASKPTTDVRSKNTRSTESSTSPKSSKKSVKSPKKSGRTPRKQRSPSKSRRSPRSSRSSPKMSIGSPKELGGSPKKSTRSPQKSKVSPKKSPKSPQKSKTSSNKSSKSPRKSKASPKKSPKSPQKPKGSPKKSGGSPHSSSSLSPSPRLQQSGALTRSARRKVSKKVVISGTSPAQTSRNISTPLPPSLKKVGKRDLIVSVVDIGTTPVQLSRYLSRGAMIPPSPVNRLVRASRANPFTPKPEAVPSKLLKQNLKKKVTTEISLKNMSVSSLLDRSLVTPVTPRGGALVSRSTPASSPALPPTPPSAKYASRSYRMVATARRNISHYREETFSSSSSSTPRNSTPRRSSALYTSYLTSNRSNSDESNGHFKGASAGDTSVDTSTDSRDFTASRVEEEQQSEVQISNFDVSEGVDDTTRGYQKEDQEKQDSEEDESEEENEEEENDSEEQKPASKKGYCSVM